MAIDLKRVCSGGQSGCDQAALRAARAAGIPTGGWCPLGWLTEDGPAPWLADYGLRQTRTTSYAIRTVANVEDSDATLWLGETGSPGYRATSKACRAARKPMLVVEPGMTQGPALAWMELVIGLEVLNIAGSRESRSPGIGERAERWLTALFRRIAAGRPGPPRPDP